MFRHSTKATAVVFSRSFCIRLAPWSMVCRPCPSASCSPCLACKEEELV